jgi:hypothetical protein
MVRLQKRVLSRKLLRMLRRSKLKGRPKNLINELSR